MAFKMNPGRVDYAKTGKGIPMSFKQDNVPPKKGEKDKIQGTYSRSTKTISRKEQGNPKPTDSKKKSTPNKQTPPEDAKSGERVVQIKGSTNRVSPRAIRKLSKGIVEAAKEGFESTAYATGSRNSSVKITKDQHGKKSLNINIFGKGGGKLQGLDGSNDLTYTGKKANLSVKEVKNLFKKTGGATYEDGELRGGTTATKTLPAPRPKSQYQLNQKAKLEQLRETRDKKNADREIARQERRQDMLNKSKPKR